MDVPRMGRHLHFVGENFQGAEAARPGQRFAGHRVVGYHSSPHFDGFVWIPAIEEIQINPSVSTSTVLALHPFALF